MQAGQKEAFRKYLERSGAVDALTKVLVALFEENEKPEDAIEFIRQHVGGQSQELATLRAESDALKKENAALQKQVADLMAQLAAAKGGGSSS